MSRLVIVTPSLDEPGGIASVVSTVTSGPLASGYDLVVVPTVRGTGVMRHVRGAWGVLRACLAIAHPGVCLVHLHVSVGASFHRKAFVARFARLMGRPTLLHLHGGRFASWIEAGGERRRARVATAFMKADRVAVLSAAWQDVVARLVGRTDAVVVPNPVEIPARLSVGVAGDHVVFLGRLDPRKGIDDLLEAIGRLQAAGIDASWTLAGDGDVERIRARVATLPAPHRVGVPGWLSARDASETLQHAAVLCLPSYDEGLPMAMLEAMAHGLTCVVTPVGGIPDVIEDGVNGVIVTPGNADELTEALARVLQEPELRCRMGAQARETAIARFSAQKVAQVLQDVYVSMGCTPDEGRT